MEEDLKLGNKTKNSKATNLEKNKLVNIKNLFSEVRNQVKNGVIFSEAYIQSDFFVKPVELPPAGHYKNTGLRHFASFFRPASSIHLLYYDTKQHRVDVRVKERTHMRMKIINSGSPIKI